MFKNMTLQTRLIVAFLFMGLLVLVVALIGWSGNARLSEHINVLVTNSVPSVTGLWKINEGQTQIESSERALLNSTLTLEQRQTEVGRIKRAWEQINEGFEQYEATPRAEEEEKIYQRLLLNWDTWKQDHEAFLKLNQKFESLGVLNPNQKQVDLLRQGKDNSPEMAGIMQASSALTQLRERAQANRNSFESATQSILEDLKLNEAIVEQANKQAEQDVSQSTFWVFLGMVLGPVTALIFGVFFSRTIARPLGVKIAKVMGVAEQISAGDLTTQIERDNNNNDEVGKLQNAFYTMTQNLNSLIRQVQQSGIQVTTSSTKIAASGKQLETTVTEQVASTNEVVAAAKEITATSTELVKTMEEVATMSQLTTGNATSSQKDLDRMESTMRQLVQATNSISTKLEVISEKANNINSVVVTITKVADQTNLLSLNAAIEAEKAGEYGLGFAVVAREIRRLADQTAVATLDIEQMVKEMQSAVSTGVMEMDKFAKEVGRGVEDVSNISEQLGQMIEQVQSLTPRFELVNQGMEAQSQGAQQISEAMVQLSETSVQTADSLRDINGAIEQLNNAAQGLRREISRFKVNTQDLSQQTFMPHQGTDWQPSY